MTSRKSQEILISSNELITLEHDNRKNYLDPSLLLYFRNASIFGHHILQFHFLLDEEGIRCSYAYELTRFEFLDFYFVFKYLRKIEKMVIY